MGGIIVVDVNGQRVLGMRRRGTYREIPGMIRQIYEFAVEKEIAVTEGPVFLWHEKTVEEAMKADKEGRADIEVAFPIKDMAEGADAGTDDIRCYDLPGGKMAKIVHKGPYEEAGPCYEELFAWIDRNGRRLAAPVREVYLNDPREVPRDEILTEIYAPIE